MTDDIREDLEEVTMMFEESGEALSERLARDTGIDRGIVKVLVKIERALRDLDTRISRIEHVRAKEQFKKI